VIDRVSYSDRDGWPAGADGSSASLERICPAAPGTLAGNWAASYLPRFRKSAGTPGMRNDNHAPDLPPLIKDVGFDPPAPGERALVTALVADAGGVEEVSLSYVVLSVGAEDTEASIVMERVSGDEKEGKYQAAIPAIPEGRLVRFKVLARDVRGMRRIQPHESEPRPTYSFSTIRTAGAASIPIAQVINTGLQERESPRWDVRRQGDPSPTRGNGAFLIAPSGTNSFQLFDHVRITPRHGGFKVRFQRDRPFRGMTVINLLLENSARWALSEHLSHELHRLAGVPAPQTDHVRIRWDGRVLGYHLLVEQPNRSFLSRNGRKDSGNLYKLLWYGRGIVGQHEKKTNRATGHDDLLEVIGGLQAASGEEGWKYIQQRFEVDEVASYFAACMCTSDWDGFHNNYFAYHAPGGGGKWEVYPWDKDKTWGDYDSASSAHDWHEMPLTMGMEGDRSPAMDLRSRINNLWGAFGGVSWWRRGGYFSRPLLANPDFRKVFLARLGELCRSVFTEEKLFPVIDSLEKRLEPEVPIRAEAQGEDPRRALRDFKRDVQSLRDQVKHRRGFILAELEKAREP
jgi:hypothetical protein